MPSFLSLRAACCAALLLVSTVALADEITPDAYREQAWSLYGQGRYNEALFYYGKALTQQPQHQAALYESALASLKLGLMEPAQVQLDRLKQACGACPEVARLERVIAQKVATK